MAMTTTMMPTTMAITHAGALRLSSMLVNCWGSLSFASTPEAENAATMVTPMTPNWGAVSPSTFHQPRVVFGRWRRPRNSTSRIITTGIHVIRLIALDITRSV
jgi:hypothetical protein